MVARSDVGASHAADLVEYAETAARYQVLNLGLDAPAHGLSDDDLRAVCAPLDNGAALVVATCIARDPTGYGRILRKGGAVVAIREHRDLATDEERAVREINAGIYALDAGLLREALGALVPNNAQGELYLTDAVRHLVEGGETVAALRGLLVGSGHLDDGLIDTFLAHCADPGWWTETISFTAVRARKS